MQTLRVAHNQRRHLRLVLYQIDITSSTAVKLTHGAFDFRVTAMSDEDALAAIIAVARHFNMHFCHQRTGGVEHTQTTHRRLFAHRLRHAVGTEDHDAIIGHLVQLLHEDRATGTQVVDYESVVHYLVAHINRRAEHLQRPIDDIDSAIHTRAKPPGIGETNVHQCNSAGSTRCTCTSNRIVRPASGWLKSTVTSSSSKATISPGSSPPAASANENTRPISSATSSSK